MIPFPKKKYNIINIDALYYCADKNNVLGEIQDSPYYIFIKGIVFKIIFYHKI